MNETKENILLIRTVPKPRCILCGLAGTELYDRLQDRLFGAPGIWTLKRCPDNACGLVWLDPAPDADELWKAYVKYYTHGQQPSGHLVPVRKRAYYFVRDCYLALRHGYFPGKLPSRLKWLGAVIYLFPGRRADVDFSVMHLGYKPGGRLLEVGCGNGSMLEYLASLGWRVKGLDIDPQAVESARRRGLDVTVGSLEQSNCADNQFDAVIMSHVIEHVPDPAGLVAECRRVLKPGGMLSLVTPNVESYGSRFFGRSWLHLDPPRHLNLFTIRALRNLTRAAGFSEVTVGTTVRDAHGLFWASRSIKRHGSFTMGTRPGACVNALLLLLRMAEWLMLKFSPARGEEISLIGVK